MERVIVEYSNISFLAKKPDDTWVVDLRCFLQNFLSQLGISPEYIVHRLQVENFMDTDGFVPLSELPDILGNVYTFCMGGSLSIKQDGKIIVDHYNLDLLTMFENLPLFIEYFIKGNKIQRVEYGASKFVTKGFKRTNTGSLSKRVDIPQYLSGTIINTLEEHSFDIAASNSYDY